MRKAIMMLVSAWLSTGCGDSKSAAPDGGASGGDGGGTVDGSQQAQPDAGSSGPWAAGNPDGRCSSALPALAQPVSVATPTTVVGSGAGTCDFAKLSAAVAKGGIITFDCGSAPVTIPVTATLNLLTTKDTVIDGGRLVTLDGGGTVQILRYSSPDFRKTETRVTLQHLRVVNGKIAGSMPIPVATPPCSQGFNDGEGGAIFMRDGNLSVIDCIFEDNHAAPTGPDVGGGAIRMLGSKHGIVIAGSTFKRNSASNGAAVGCLFAELAVYDSLFDGNTASGHDANNDDSSKCNVINNGQHEIGSGGNGGALYSDGASLNVNLCGDQIVNNAAGANAFGGGLFFTSNDFGGTLTIADTTMSGNTGGHWTSVMSGATNNAGTAVGTNTKSLTITNSKLQGLP